MADQEPTVTVNAHPVAVLPVPGWECFFGVNDVDFYDLVFYVWVVRGANWVGLIDTGLPINEHELESLQQASQPVDPRCRFRDIVPLPEVLKTEGLVPSDIDVIAITQTITYCTGGLLPELVGAADVYMSRAGMLEFLLDPPGHPRPAFYFQEDSWSLLRTLRIAGRLHLVDEPVEIRPGLLFETTGGHHPGSAGVQLRTREHGRVGILETAFRRRNVEEGLPVGIAEDAAAARSAIVRYRDECDVVLAGHEPGLEDFPWVGTVPPST